MLASRAFLALAAASVANADCCGNGFAGTCADGTVGTPCCGKGKCNAFCCSCDGGCRQSPSPVPSPPPASSVPLNEWPMLMAHDSGTCYYSKSTCKTLTTEVNNYVMTQTPGQFSDQLNNGARAFDIRLYLKSGNLIMHHDFMTINTKVADALSNIKEWSRSNPTELVLVYGSHCSGKSDNDKSGCQGAYAKVLSDAGIPLISCEDIAKMTVGAALSRGPIIAISECVEENWDPKIKCYRDVSMEASGDNTSTARRLGNKAVCYGDNSKEAFDPFWNYIAKLTNTADVPHKGEATLWITQGHWQYDTASVKAGLLHNSCILEDESKSNVNGQLAERISRGDFKHINILEVDDILNNGNAIFTALRSRFNYDLNVEVDRLVV